MLNAPRPFAAALALSLWSCTPPCETTSPAPQEVCYRDDAGVLTPDASFVLEATTYMRNGTCRVGIDGGQIDLAIDGMFCSSTGGSGAAAPAPPSVVRCEIPPLPAGTYVVVAGVPATFTLPGSGLPSCR